MTKHEPERPFSDIEIWYFRGIQHASISDFKRVNLFVGKNNSGKTTVLESLYLLASSTYEQLQGWTTMLKERNPIYDDLYWDALFYNFDAVRYIVLRANQGKLTLKIEKEYTLPKVRHSLGDADEIFNLKVSSAESEYSVNFDTKNDKQMKVTARLEGRSLHFRNNIFLTTNAVKEILASFAADFDKIQDAKLVSLLSDSLRPIEPNIRDFRISSKRVVKADIASLQNLLPVNLMGEGMVRLLGIIMKIANAKDGVVLIDEIESGFHHSALETMWKAVFEAAKNFNVQLFATTHSQECLKAFAHIQIEGDEDSRRVFRLSKKENDTRVTAYNRDNLLASFEIEVEVR